LVIVLNKAVNLFSIHLIHRCSHLSCMWLALNLCLALFKLLSPVIHMGPWWCLSLICALSLVRISAGFTFSLVRNLTKIHYATAEWSTCSLIMITTDRKQVHMQWCFITSTVFPSLATSKVILFYMEFFVFEGRSPDYIWTPLVL
jgi:hypothetical protein